VQPAKLIRGLAAAVRALGVTIHESTRVLDVGPGRARTDRGSVRAEAVLGCLEGFTPSLRSDRRSMLTLNSAMVVTDPLSSELWRAVGWDRGELLGDGAHAYTYAQRTADGGSRSAGAALPYRLGSRTDRWG